MSNDIFLNDVWTLYFHDPDDSNWTCSSYINMGNISTVDDFWNHASQFKAHIHKGMFFLMREHIFPCWDDQSNLNGGCFSLKVLKDDLSEFWEDLCLKLLGEVLLKDEISTKWDLINGISTSPKKHFCIIKIWMKTLDIDQKESFDILPDYYGDVLFKSNLESINNDSNKVTPETS